MFSEWLGRYTIQNLLPRITKGFRKVKTNKSGSAGNKYSLFIHMYLAQAKLKIANVQTGSMELHQTSENIIRELKQKLDKELLAAKKLTGNQTLLESAKKIALPREGFRR